MTSSAPQRGSRGSPEPLLSRSAIAEAAVPQGGSREQTAWLLDARTPVYRTERVALHCRTGPGTGTRAGDGPGNRARQGDVRPAPSEGGDRPVLTALRQPETNRRLDLAGGPVALQPPVQVLHRARGTAERVRHPRRQRLRRRFTDVLRQEHRAAGRYPVPRGIAHHPP